MSTNKANITENDTADNILSKWGTKKFNLAYGDSAHTEGKDNLALGNYSHAEGQYTKATGDSSHTEGYNTSANGNYSHAEGKDTFAEGISSHVEGQKTTAVGDNSHVEGLNNIANGTATHTEGTDNNKNSGECNHIEGFNNVVYANYTHVGGTKNTISAFTEVDGKFNVVEGTETTTETSYVVGSTNKVGKLNGSELNSFGVLVAGTGNTVLSSTNSLVIGSSNVNKDLSDSIVSGTRNKTEITINSFVSGYKNNCNEVSHGAIFGSNNIVSGSYVFSSGLENRVANEAESAFGKYNNRKDNTIFSVGIGSGDSNRKNGIEVTNTGDIFINYNQTKDQGKINVFASANNINEATFIDQEGKPYTLLTYMSIQDVIDWLSSRINNLYDFVNKLKTDNNLN